MSYYGYPLTTAEGLLPDDDMSTGFISVFLLDLNIVTRKFNNQTTNI